MIETGRPLLALIVELIDKRASWWEEQTRSLIERAGEEDLSSWLLFARSAVTPDAVLFALRKFVSQVDSRSHAWLEKGEDWDIRTTLYEETRRLIDRPISNLKPPAFRGLPLGRSDNSVALTSDVKAMLARNCVVAVGVSGGKDSDACAIAVDRHLKAIGHTGPRVLIHADLGRVEWRDSLPNCERLAAHLGWELMVVRRKAGDMLARWQGRWANNVWRYANLECVKLILPWSTPSMRFCTSELKTDAISAELKRCFPAREILNVVGIRRQESSNRSRMPVAAVQAKLSRKGHTGMAWNAIIDWPVEDVLATIEEAGLPLHEAYVRYGASRVSCAFCIMSSLSDLHAAVSCKDNHDLYRTMVELEAGSTFAFQGNRWLGDLAPEILPESLRNRIEEAKRKAAQRQEIEAEIPKHLLFEAGWPQTVPTDEDAALLASVRRRIAALLGIEIGYVSGPDIQLRYAELLGSQLPKPKTKPSFDRLQEDLFTCFEPQKSETP